ncbi:MAG: U32 family peptidase [Erysipelotrichaceae bacterium]
MSKFIVTPYSISDIKLLKDINVKAVLINTAFLSVTSTSCFDLSDLSSIKNECKECGLELYINVNSFFMEEDIDKLIDSLKKIRDVSVDGIYFSDLGVLYEAEKLGMLNLLIYNPETLICNEYDAKYFLDLGIKRVVLSKEITLSDIGKITNSNLDPKRLEVFIHGRTLMMNSRRKLVSNYLKFIKEDSSIVKDNSKLYLIEEKRSDHLPIIEDDKGTRIYSGYILNAIEDIEALVEYGIDNFIIDVMGYGIQYVITIIKLYSNIIDGTITKELAMKELVELTKDRIDTGFFHKATSTIKVGD